MEIQFALAYIPPYGGGLGFTPDYTDSLTIAEAEEWGKLLRAQKIRERQAALVNSRGK